jgi:hypothetical protein
VSILILEELRQRVRDRADMPSLSRPTTAQLDALINEKAKRLHALVALKDTNSFAKLSSNQTIASNEDYISLSGIEDFWKLLGVDVLVGSRWQALRPYTLRERNDIDSGEMRYLLRGGELVFIPVPVPYPTVRLLYIPSFTPLVLEDDTLDGSNGWEGLVVLDCAIQLLNDEESDSSALVRERAALLAQLEAEVDNRDQGEPYVVADVRDREGW